MKKLFLLGLVLVLFTACKKEEQRYFSESSEIEILKAGIKAYEAKDWDVWKSNFADTAKIYHNTDKGSAPDDVMKNFESMLSNFSSYGFSDKGEFIEMVIDKDQETWVNYWGHWNGKLLANEKELHIPVHLTAQFINGKIVEEYAYYDTVSIVSALQDIEAEKMAIDAAEATEE